MYPGVIKYLGFHFVITTENCTLELAEYLFINKNYLGLNVCLASMGTFQMSFVDIKECNILELLHIH